MTAVLDLSMMFAAAAIGIAPPGTRWISEHLVTRRRREALHALERTAAADSTTACLVADTARAARRRHAQDETRTPIGTTVHGTYRCDAAGSVLTFDPNHPICSSAPIRAPDPGRPPSWSITRCRGVLAEVTNEADDILAAERRFYCGSTIMSRRRSCGGAITTMRVANRVETRSWSGVMRGRSRHERLCARPLANAESCATQDVRASAD